MGDSQTVWPDILNIRQDVFKPDVFNYPHLEYLLIYNTKAVRRRRCPILFVRIPYRLSLDIIIRVLFVGAAVRTLPAIIFNDKSLAWTERSCACAPIYLIASLLGGSSQINIRPPKRKHFTIYRSGPPIRRQFIHPTSSDIDDA